MVWRVPRQRSGQNERTKSIEEAAAVKGISEMRPTATESRVPLRAADFSTLSEALDYAAQGDTGCNFYSDRGQLSAVLSYADLRHQAQALGRRLLGLKLERGASVALVADTHPDFQRLFFACQYAGLVPVPLPASPHLSNRHGYVTQLRGLLTVCKAAVAIAPAGFLPFLSEAAAGLQLRFLGSLETVAALPESDAELHPLQPTELAYLQYTSGSTRFPRGVTITQEAVMNNLSGIIKHGLQIRAGDRAVSWLPYYHDMGLVGFVLGPLASQISVDYLTTRAFAMRPRQWLALMTQSRATISFSPSFGYEMCVRRLREEETDQFDLSAWRAAGVGAETIRPEPLNRFADLLAPSGFDRRAFLACYGMAECALAVSFAPLAEGLHIDRVDRNHLAEHQEAFPAEHDAVALTPVEASSYVNCGTPLPGLEVAVRDDLGRTLGDRQCGTLFVKGSSVMSGYFGDLKATREVLAGDGWLDTGDVGYRMNGSIVIIGRKKDVIIINGRNIWPQDLEYLAEQIPDVRPGDVSAFSVVPPDSGEIAVMVVQCRETEPDKRDALVKRLQGLLREEFGLECFVELVAPHTLPRTSSGKLSRSRTREDFLTRVDWEQLLGARAGSLNGRSAQVPYRERQTAPCVVSSP